MGSLQAVSTLLIVPVAHLLIAIWLHWSCARFDAIPYTSKSVFAVTLSLGRRTPYRSPLNHIAALLSIRQHNCTDLLAVGCQLVVSVAGSIVRKGFTSCDVAWSVDVRLRFLVPLAYVRAVNRVCTCACVVNSRSLHT